MKSQAHPSSWQLYIWHVKGSNWSRAIKWTTCHLVWCLSHATPTLAGLCTDTPHSNLSLSFSKTTATKLNRIKSFENISSIGALYCSRKCSFVKYCIWSKHATINVMVIGHKLFKAKQLPNTHALYTIQEQTIQLWGNQLTYPASFPYPHIKASFAPITL